MSAPLHVLFFFLRFSPFPECTLQLANKMGLKKIVFPIMAYAFDGMLAEWGGGGSRDVDSVQHCDGAR
jgi:hypothetical protein